MNPQPSLEARAPGVVRFYSFLPRAQGLSEDVLAGLALPQKSIPPKYFYDEQGCRLFEAICELPEYYLTRTEMAILHGNIAEIAQFVGVPIRRKTVFFPGSTIGNFTPAEALVFLRQARTMAGAGGVLLIGVDLKKDKATLDAAYADGRGVTEQFNLNLLHRINRELAADFQVKRFRHKAFYDPILGRVEMHLESQYSQFVHVAGRRFDFAPGETIHTEISCKYSIAEFQELGKRAGFTPERVWTDSEQLFSVHGMVAS